MAQVFCELNRILEGKIGFVCWPVENPISFPEIAPDQMVRTGIRSSLTNCCKAGWNGRAKLGQAA